MAEQATTTSLYPVVFDTDILIWYLRGSEKALRAINHVAYSRRTISILSIMELTQGCRNGAEIRAVKLFVSENFTQVLYLKETVCRLASDLLERHALPNGLRVVDALIAASTLNTNGSLATANLKHYRPIANLHLIPFKP
ncbi:MAG TPA: type II toxin-antitoxin system VapC family toxin [Candidatus Limnocylindria bacterium]|nr:type II toxin-antitoxin system VapC family toxin [Candidatus Limnocylindria bacterium]